MAEFSSYTLVDIKQDVYLSEKLCTQRGLYQSAKWAAELAYSLDQVAVKVPEVETSEEFLADYDKFIMARRYFDLREYERAAHFLSNCSSTESYFVKMYSLYMANEKKALDNSVDILGHRETSVTQSLSLLRAQLASSHFDGNLDGFALYLYGVVLKRLGLLSKAVEVMVEAVNREPLHWGAWQELALLIHDKDMLLSLSLPEHWMKQFFLAHAYLELQQKEDALKLYLSLSEQGFAKSTYVMAQIAETYNHLRETDLAVESFGRLQKADPLRLDNMDTYSNMLFVKEMKAELANLAHQCSNIDKYRVETCCVIGNYYGLRGQHENAVVYFRRALRLNPNYLSAWTLMGHSYVELKNAAAAREAYRKAVEVNNHDFRAWYGLGQTYELLKLPSYCLYYYRQAHMLRPNDSRMIVAMGDAYEKLERPQEAKKCFWKAHSVGDMEGTALIRLANLHRRLCEDELAAQAFGDYVAEMEAQHAYSDDLAQAYLYLASFHVNRHQLDEAYANAQKCTESVETREEGKALLREVSRLRSLGNQDTGSQSIIGAGMSVDRPGSLLHTASRSRTSTPPITAIRFTPE